MYFKEHKYYWCGEVQMGGTNELPIPNGCQDQVSNVKSGPTSPCQDPGKVYNVPGEHA